MDGGGRKEGGGKGREGKKRKGRRRKKGRGKGRSEGKEGGREGKGRSEGKEGEGGKEGKEKGKGGEKGKGRKKGKEGERKGERGGKREGKERGKGKGNERGNRRGRKTGKEMEGGRKEEGKEERKKEGKGKEKGKGSGRGRKRVKDVEGKEGEGAGSRGRQAAVLLLSRTPGAAQEGFQLCCFQPQPRGSLRAADGALKKAAQQPSLGRFLRDLCLLPFLTERQAWNKQLHGATAGSSSDLCSHPGVSGSAHPGPAAVLLRRENTATRSNHSCGATRASSCAQMGQRCSARCGSAAPQCAPSVPAPLICPTARTRGCIPPL